MLDIIPNWHPIFVHFTVALFSLSIVLFVVTPFVKPALQDQWWIVARWCLWFGAGLTLITGLSGLYAYNTVAHDTTSHAAMTEHRNWAVATITVFFVLTAWSVIRIRRRQTLGAIFATVMVFSGGLLASTAWHGGEVVYRYGLGVKSLPKPEGEGHAHDHADGHSHTDKAQAETASTPSTMHTENMHEITDEHHDDGDHHHANSDDAQTESDVSVMPGNATSDATAKSTDHHDNGHAHTH